VTLRNSQQKFHSNGHRQLSFNDQKYDKLTKDSRYRTASEVDHILTPESPMQKVGQHTIALDTELQYDIKGNTYKDTLIPEKSAKSAFSRHRGMNNTMYG
jgi:hypothetical protein